MAAPTDHQMAMLRGSVCEVLTEEEEHALRTLIDAYAATKTNAQIVVREISIERDAARAEVDRLKAECAQISVEFGLPPLIRPAEGEIRRMVDSLARVTAERDAMGLRETALRQALQRHSQLARTLSVNPNLYRAEHLEKRLAEADVVLSASPEELAKGFFALFSKEGA